MKSLFDLSWNVPEEEYRKDKAYSYSTIAKYHRERFDKINNLFEPTISTPSLVFGSIVDTIITGNKKEFDQCINLDYNHLMPLYMRRPEAERNLEEKKNHG